MSISFVFDKHLRRRRRRRHIDLLVVLLLQFVVACCSVSADGTELQIYIIHVEKTPDHLGSHREWHESFLEDGQRLVYSYGHTFSGFAARLTAEELEAVRTKEGFLGYHLDRTLSLDTTHSPAFLGLHRGSTSYWRGSGGYGKGVVIGVLDTGISPTHPSFHDKGMPPPPNKWIGGCDFKPKTLCNNKIVGARVFITSNSSETPFDSDGHGTHTASTAAGRFVGNASVLGNAMGTSAGMAPFAHLAMYKVCNDEGCEFSDVLAGIETAVKDGVDVISMSLSSDNVPFYDDSTSIAAFGAMKHGVFVTGSAGNTGPTLSSVRNVEPWVLTVGASTINRRIPAVVKLGNGVELVGESAYQPTNFSSTFLPIVDPTSSTDLNSTYCTDVATLKKIGVKGKMVLCRTGLVTRIEKGEFVKKAGGVAMILTNPSSRGFDTYAEAHVIPTSHVTSFDREKITNYINSTSKPTATIVFKGTTIGGLSDPIVAAFSSRGPSFETPGVLKPDIIGPGVNILAAWHEPVGPFVVSPPFNMISGTSMSCPHLAGIVALVKSAHPDWSPAMIKSAIMTTAGLTNLKGDSILDNYKHKPATFYDIGSGHVNPARANNPGLVYDIQPDDYISYLCAIAYTDKQVTIIAQRRINCSMFPKTDEVDLNYPSFSVELGSKKGYKRQVHRVVTNVGRPNSSYRVEVVQPVNVTVKVYPEKLNFRKKGEKKSYVVSFSLSKGVVSPETSDSAMEGSLSWVSSDGHVRVRSPIVVTMASSSNHTTGLPFQLLHD